MEVNTAAQFKVLRLNRLKATQKQLAEKIGVTSNYISLIENGHRPVSSLVLLAIAKGYGLEFSYEFK